MEVLTPLATQGILGTLLIASLTFNYIQYRDRQNIVNQWVQDLKAANESLQKIMEASNKVTQTFQATLSSVLTIVENLQNKA